ncbi:MAG: acyl-CoA dehydrogenase family protein [Mycobacteriaceae bacterium]
MDLTLSEEHQALKESAAAFVDKEIVPHAPRWDHDESVDRDIVGKLGAAGLLGLGVPEEMGGSGGDMFAYCLAIEELGRGDQAIRGIVSVSLGLVAKSIVRYGTPEQQERWLPGLCSGEQVACFGLTEPGTGSDAGALTTKAVRDGSDYLITGSKQFITNGNWADVALVMARTGGEGARGVSAFLVPTSSEGFSATKISDKLGLRGQDTAALHLDSVRVPASAMLGEEGRGFTVAMTALDRGRASIAASAVGLATACLDAALSYAQDRTQFGKKIASFQLVQQLLVETQVERDAARLLVWKAADLADHDQPFRTEASAAKYYAAEMAVRAANRCLQVYGGYGFTEEYPLAKYLRDARVLTLYEGTTQVQTLLLGRALTGVSAFS